MEHFKCLLSKMESRESDDNHTFENLCLHPSLLHALSGCGLMRPSRMQHRALSALLNGCSLILQSKSGTGKTLSYCIYILDAILKNKNAKNGAFKYIHNQKNTRQSETHWQAIDAVIITPTRELSLQVQRVLVNMSSGLNIEIFFSIGGGDILEESKQLLRSPPNIFVTTPGRLRSMFKQLKRKPSYYKEYVNVSEEIWSFVKILVLDEADVLVNEQFIEQTRLVCEKLLHPYLQVIAASATFIKPEFRHFEDIILTCDEKYIDAVNQVFDKAGDSDCVFDLLPCSLLYNWYIAFDPTSIEINDKMIKGSRGNNYCVKRLKDFLNTQIRNIVKQIISASHVSHYDVKTIEMLGGCGAGKITEETELCFVENDDKCGISDLMESSASDIVVDSTPVVAELINFFCVQVMDAPSIVAQISVKLNCLLTVLKLLKYTRCIIFCNQGHARLQVLEVLLRYGFSAMLTSTRTSNKDRKASVQNVNAEDATILLCTDMISRGIDVHGVDLVINMDIPKTKEIFIHRAGRTGRFEEKGNCLSIVMKSEEDIFDYFVYSLKFACKSIMELLPIRDDLGPYINEENVWTLDPFLYPHFMPRVLSNRGDVCSPMDPHDDTQTRKFHTLIETIFDIDDTDINGLLKSKNNKRSNHHPCRNECLLNFRKAHANQWQRIFQIQ